MDGKTRVRSGRGRVAGQQNTSFFSLFFPSCHSSDPPPPPRAPNFTPTPPHTPSIGPADSAAMSFLNLREELFSRNAHAPHHEHKKRPGLVKRLRGRKGSDAAAADSDSFSCEDPSNSSDPELQGQISRSSFALLPTSKSASKPSEIKSRRRGGKGFMSRSSSTPNLSSLSSLAPPTPEPVTQDPPSTTTPEPVAEPVPEVVSAPVAFASPSPMRLPGEGPSPPGTPPLETFFTAVKFGDDDDGGGGGRSKSQKKKKALLPRVSGGLRKVSSGASLKGMLSRASSSTSLTDLGKPPPSPPRDVRMVRWRPVVQILTIENIDDLEARVDLGELFLTDADFAAMKENRRREIEVLKERKLREAERAEILADHAHDDSDGDLSWASCHRDDNGTEGGDDGHIGLDMDGDDDDGGDDRNEVKLDPYLETDVDTAASSSSSISEDVDAFLCDRGIEHHTCDPEVRRARGAAIKATIRNVIEVQEEHRRLQPGGGRQYRRRSDEDGSGGRIYYYKEDRNPMDLFQTEVALYDIANASIRASSDASAHAFDLGLADQKAAGIRRSSHDYYYR